MARSINYDKNKHLIGSFINDWEILDIVIYETKQHTYVLAKCKCGTIKEVRLSYLMNNKILDCGCGYQERRMEKIQTKYNNLINSTINGWTILEILPSNSTCNYAMAKCRCKCGTVKNVRLSYILNHKSKDCGCGRKNTLSDIKTNNLVGKKFGKLLVVELLEESNKFKRRMYRCKCDCGNEVVTSSICLQNHHTLSCGCLVSYWNSYIGQFLTNKGVKFKSEYQVQIEDVCYRFDFYLPDYNLFIEYDGEQHYKIVPKFGGEEGFKKRKKYDEIKNSYCKENNINLLRIPYWETLNIEEIINNYLQRLNIKDSENQGMQQSELTK